uniref:Uncharacterized protein n=1 Tax=Triticum urartu TaxID=4572 RepID=A0A8R7P4G0_TRIUA
MGQDRGLWSPPSDEHPPLPDTLLPSRRRRPPLGPQRPQERLAGGFQSESQLPELTIRDRSVGAEAYVHHRVSWHRAQPTDARRLAAAAGSGRWQRQRHWADEVGALHVALRVGLAVLPFQVQERVDGEAEAPGLPRHDRASESVVFRLAPQELRQFSPRDPYLRPWKPRDDHILAVRVALDGASEVAHGKP